MLTFLRLRPGELRQASLKDLDMRKGTFLIASPKGRYGEVKRMTLPDVLKPFATDFLNARAAMFGSKGIDETAALILAISRKGVGVYFPTGVRSFEGRGHEGGRDQLQMEGLPAYRRAVSVGRRSPDRSGISEHEARIDTDNGAVLLPRQS
jgi:hypothetical protein